MVAITIVFSLETSVLSGVKHLPGRISIKEYNAKRRRKRKKWTPDGLMQCLGAAFPKSQSLLVL